MTTPALRAAFFDIDDTLFSTSDFAWRARRRAMEAMVALGGLGMSVEDLLAELKEVIAEFGSNDTSHYDRTLRRFPEGSLGGHSRDTLVAAGVVAYHNTKVHEFAALPGVVEGLARLRERTDLKLGIITEGLAVKQSEKLIRLGVYPYLDSDAIFISDRIGISKPNPKLWQMACRRTGVEPGECVYLGDSPTADIAPARAIGMAAIRMRIPDGKHAATEAPVPADHEVADFDAYVGLLRDVWGLDV